MVSLREQLYWRQKHQKAQTDELDTHAGEEYL